MTTAKQRAAEAAEARALAGAPDAVAKKPAKKRAAKKTTTRRKTVRQTAVVVEVEPADAAVTSLPRARKRTTTVVDAGTVELRSPHDIGGRTHNSDTPRVKKTCAHPRIDRVNLGWGIRCDKCGHVLRPGE